MPRYNARECCDKRSKDMAKRAGRKNAKIFSHLPGLSIKGYFNDLFSDFHMIFSGAIILPKSAESNRSISNLANVAWLGGAQLVENHPKK